MNGWVKVGLLVTSFRGRLPARDPHRTLLKHLVLRAEQSRGQPRSGDAEPELNRGALERECQLGCIAT